MDLVKKIYLDLKRASISINITCKIDCFLEYGTKFNSNVTKWFGDYRYR